MKTVKELLLEEISLVESFTQVREKLELRVSESDIDTEAFQYSDNGGDETTIADSEKYFYFFIQEPFSVAAANNGNLFDVVARRKGSFGGTAHDVMPHRGLI